MEAGASVIIVEQQTQTGFHSLGAQAGVINSEFLAGLGAPEYEPVDFIKDYQHRSLNRANPELIRQYAWHGGEALDWFIDPLPEEQRPKGQPQPLSMAASIVFTHRLIEAEGGRFFYGITGRALEKANGSVTALIGSNYKKEFYRFKANRAVILASVDFSGDREMAMDLLGEFADLTENGEKYQYLPGGWKGLGIKLGLLAGGRMEPSPRGGMWCCVRGNGGPVDGSAF